MDPAPGFQALKNDPILLKYGITINIGPPKNINKNPVAERAIQELEIELLKQDPSGSPVNTSSLAIATNRLNSRIRSRGLSSWEMLTQRNQYDNKQISISDRHLIDSQHSAPTLNHPYSEACKAPGRQRLSPPSLQPGDVVYLHQDYDKNKARPRYLVVSISPPHCNLRKFTDTQFRDAQYRVKLSNTSKLVMMKLAMVILHFSR